MLLRGKMLKCFTFTARTVAVQFVISFDGSWASRVADPKSGLIQVVA
jgi:hypothetical protein